MLTRCVLMCYDGDMTVPSFPRNDNPDQATGDNTKVSHRSGYRTYPRSDTHTWGMFAMLAIEGGGYADLEAVDPTTGRTLWVGRALDNDEENIYQALRKLIDEMERVDFLGA